MAYSPDQITQLALLVKEGVQSRGTVSDLSLPLQNYTFPKFMAKGKLPEGASDDSGTSMTFRIMTSFADNFRVTGLMDTNNTGRNENVARGTVKWSKQDTSCSYDIDEPEFNGKGMQQIANHLELLMHGMYNSFYQGMERLIYTQPSGPDESPFGVLGLPHWLVNDTTSTTPAFTGGNPTGFSAGAAGISSTTYTGWDNCTFGFPLIDWDFIDALFKAFYLTKFEAPHKFPQTNTGKSGYFFATTYDNVAALRKVLRSANENYGTKEVLAFKDIVLNSQQIEASSYLTQNSGGVVPTNVFYAVNLAHLGFKAKASKQMKLTDPIRRPDAYSVYDVFLYNWMQGWCDNRREAGFVCGQQ
jgi:hypothetical protein